MPKADENCYAEGCADKIGTKGARGYCPFHYRRFSVTGDPLLSPRDIATQERQCEDCEQVYKPRNGISRKCDPCRKASQLAYNRRWRENNPNYHSEYNKRWREENPDRRKAYLDWYRSTHPERVKATYRRWESANPDHAREWLAKNRERARENVRRRRSRLRAVATFAITERDIKRMLARHRNCCAYCSEPLTDGYHVDHVVPVSRGGANGIGNLAPACASCNVSKRNWLLSEWRYSRQLGRKLRRPAATHKRAA